MASLVKKIKSVISKQDKKDDVMSNAQDVTMQQRENHVYDAEHLALQKLYEKWLYKEDWLLYKEAIPLLLGIDPDCAKKDEYAIEIEELWKHAKDCVEKKMLSVLNQTQPADDWAVLPVDLYRWATVSRICIPVEFSTLMAFIIQTVKPEPGRTELVQNKNEQEQINQKEIVLGAALSLLVNAPGQCKNEAGKVDVACLARLIIANKAEWFNQDELLLSESDIIELLSAYINSAKPVIK